MADTPRGSAAWPQGGTSTKTDFPVYVPPTYSPPCPDPEVHAAPLPGRELRYMGRRCQWVVSGEALALWVGDMEGDAVYRTVFNLHIGAAWRALRRNDALD